MNGVMTAVSPLTPVGAPTGWRSPETMAKRCVTHSLDCCDREAMGHVATTGSVTVKDVQYLMVTTFEMATGFAYSDRGVESWPLIRDFRKTWSRMSTTWRHSKPARPSCFAFSRTSPRSISRST